MIQICPIVRHREAIAHPKAVVMGPLVCLSKTMRYVWKNVHLMVSVRPAVAWSLIMESLHAYRKNTARSSVRRVEATVLKAVAVMGQPVFVWTVGNSVWTTVYPTRIVRATAVHHWRTEERLVYHRAIVSPTVSPPGILVRMPWAAVLDLHVSGSITWELFVRPSPQNALRVVRTPMVAAVADRRFVGETAWVLHVVCNNCEWTKAKWI